MNFTGPTGSTSERHKKQMFLVISGGQAGDANNRYPESSRPNRQDWCVMVFLQSPLLLLPSRCRRRWERWDGEEDTPGWRGMVGMKWYRREATTWSDDVLAAARLVRRIRSPSLQSPVVSMTKAQQFLVFIIFWYDARVFYTQIAWEMKDWLV